MGSAVVPAFGRRDAPGELDADRVTVAGLGLGALDGDDVLVAARAGDKHVTVSVPRADLDVRRVHGVDPSLGLVEISGEAAATDAGPTDWSSVVATAQLAIGHELVGASRKMLELARDHARERIQFGRPISMFQAVRHRLADTLIAVEAADALLHSAWDDRSPQTAAMAKALAGRGARTAARHCQQVLAGIGFTTEHPLHLYIRRVLVLDHLFGSTRTLTRELGTELIRTRQLPPVPPL
jgi:alkylation response protein AidB-like acyl-CoA dehydrogenase